MLCLAWDGQTLFPCDIMSFRREQEKSWGSRSENRPESLSGRALSGGAGEGKPVGATNSMTAPTTTTTSSGDPETGTESSGADPNFDNPSSLLHGQIRFDHFAAATGLIVTYFIEIIVEIFLLFECYKPLMSGTSTSWDWSCFLSLSFLVSSLVVTGVSLVWVCRSLDFAGRLCGRLLCYVLHFLMLGLLWRFLKLAFVYDRADVQEFVALRRFQTFFQSIPLTAIHLAWLIQSRDNWSSVILGIVLLELCSILTALVLSSYIKSDDQCIKSKSQVMEMIARNLSCSSSPPGQEKQVASSGTSHPACPPSCPSAFMETKLNILSRSLLLSSRLLVIAIIIVHLKYWTCLFLLAHFIVSFTWISFTLNNHSSSSPTRNVLLEDIMIQEMNVRSGKDYVFRIMEWSYILFWDVTSTPPIRLSTWILPVILVLLENGVTILFHWHRHPEPGVTILSSSCLLFGWLLFSSLILLNATSKLPKCLPPYTNTAPIEADQGKTARSPDRTFEKRQSLAAVAEPVIVTIASSSAPPNKSVGREAASEEGSSSSVNQGIAREEDDYSGEMKNSVWRSGVAESRPVWHTNPFSDVLLASIPSNYHNINEVVAKVRTNVGFKDEKMKKTGKKLLDSPEGVVGRGRQGGESCVGIQGTTGLNSSGSPVPGTTTWVPDTCCNDSNGSSNSRNTNTLREMCQAGDLLDPEQDTDGDNSHFVFYYPTTDTSIQQSVTSARFLKCSERFTQSMNTRQPPPSPILPPRPGKENTLPPRTTFSTPPVTAMKRIQEDPELGERRGRKKSRSSSSVSSSVNPRRYLTSTPVEIKKASRIVVNNNGGQSMGSSGRSGNSGTGTGADAPASKSRGCKCKNVSGGGGGEDAVINGRRDHSSYDRLMEDSYKILICEDEPPCGAHPIQAYRDPKHGQHHHPGLLGCRSSSNNNHIKSEFSSSSSSSSPQPSPSRVVNIRASIFAPAAKKLKVLCAKCLQNHDPLLSNCLVETESLVKGDDRSQVLLALRPGGMKKSKSGHDHHLHRHNHNHHHQTHHHHLHDGGLAGEGFNSIFDYYGREEGGGILNPDGDGVHRRACWDSPPNNLYANTFDQEDEDELDIASRISYGDGDIVVLEEEDYDVEDDERLESYTTDYPSGTEMTCTVEEDDLSVSSALSTATYTTWPHQSQPNLSMWTTSTMMPPSRFPKEFTSLEYVRTWLLTSQARLSSHHLRHNHHDARMSQIPKKVHRANTMSAQSRKVRFAGIGTKTPTSSARNSSKYHCHPSSRYNNNRSDTKDDVINSHKGLLNRSSNRHHPHLGKRHRPVGSGGDFLENYRVVISRSSPPPSAAASSSIPFHQPPPRQKQHPVLPHSVIPKNQKLIRPHSTKCHNRQLFNKQLVDAFYKDVEIIL